ncbi:DNA-processing protein DprA [Candidatus Saccharibacteria bacterium]|nr:DNA-processing protein DprA [Candidatus Saccharibacteria bacterium]
MPCRIFHLRANRAIGETIIGSGGAIISEYEPSSRVYPSNFLEWNRLVSGVSDAIIITEATARSGTLNTAAHALEQGKEVFVVPGNITSPLSAGCNVLLKQGARVLTSYEDVLECIAPNLTTEQQLLPLGQNELESTIIRLLDSGMRDGEAIMSECGVTTVEFNTALTMLEIAGSIKSLGANQWTLR